MYAYPAVIRTWQRIDAAHDWHIFGFGANDNPFFEHTSLQQAGAAPGAHERHPLPGSVRIGGDPFPKAEHDTPGHVPELFHARIAKDGEG